MSRLVFVTGGARSGKSGFAVSLAEKAGGRLVYVATATVGDPEMAVRVRKHREARDDRWAVIEEPVDVEAALKKLGEGKLALVLDCLTLWLTNMMMRGGGDFERLAKEKARGLVEALRGLDGTVAVVSNEVGMGIVPENALARRFRDAAGAANRVVAEAADEVYLVVSGIPVKVK